MDSETPDVDPTEMLQLMDAARRTTVRHLTRRYATLLMMWAATWALGFGALCLTRGAGALDVLAPVLGWTVFGVLIVAAIIVSTIVGVRASSDGIRGRSRLQGMLYGMSWTVTMFAASLLLWGLQAHGLSDEISQLLYPAVYVFLVGVLYLAGGALFRGIPMYLLGALMIATTVVATFLGAPLHYLVYATVAPAGMLVVAALMLWGPLEATTDDDS